VNTEPPTDDNPELTAFLKNNTSIGAKDLVKLGVPREVWNEKSFSFRYKNYVFRKSTPGDLLFNHWTIFKETGNTGL